MVSVIVMTPVRSFGEFIQQALQETGQYRVKLVHDAEAVLEQVRAGECPVVVLDFDLEPDPADLIAALFAEDSELRIIAMKNETGVDPSSLEGLHLASCLNGVFNLPDFLTALENVTADLRSSGKQSTKPDRISTFPSQLFERQSSSVPLQAPEWLQDVDRAAQHLTRLSLESAAQAALITRNVNLWAYAGHLSRLAAEELAQSVWHYWSHNGGSDLAKFVRLEANKEEYMLYATGLGGDYVLALAFETEVPFSKIRSQVGDLAKRLTTPPEELPAFRNKADSWLADPGPGAHMQPEELFASGKPDESLDEDEVLMTFPSDWRPAQDFADGRQSFFEDLLSEVDIPDPDGIPIITPSLENVKNNFLVGMEPFNPGDQDEPPSRSASMVESHNDLLETSDDKGIPYSFFDSSLDEMDQVIEEGSQETGFPFENEESATYPIPKSLKEPLFEKNVQTEQTGSDEVSGMENASPAGSKVTGEPVPEPHNDTRPPPVSITGEDTRGYQIRLEDLDPGNLALCHLSYACVLIPRLPQHHLTGDLAISLDQWVRQLALAFGWRLDHLAIRPDYLHWLGFVPPDIPPGQMVKDLREHTSQRILAEFPRLAQENPSGDFWAPGYLIVNGRDQLSSQVVDDYIEKMRFNQGIPRTRSGSRRS
jgi:REP element-mobilizing transposase RayT